MYFFSILCNFNLILCNLNLIFSALIWSQIGGLMVAVVVVVGGHTPPWAPSPHRQNTVQLSPLYRYFSGKRFKKGSILLPHQLRPLQLEQVLLVPRSRIILISHVFQMQEESSVQLFPKNRYLVELTPAWMLPITLQS